MKTQREAPTTPPDVRMRGFARRTPVEDALRWVDEHALALGSEMVGIGEAAGRTLAGDVVSAVDVPGFDRAMMDGYAVHSSDCAGASSYNRLPLNVVGEALPGRPWESAIPPGRAARVMTGAPFPDGPDAVLPVEQTEREGDNVFAVGDVASGKNIGRRGEDIAAGQPVLAAGRVLRPQDVGVLSSIGVACVSVVRQPRVRIVVTGNEILPPGTPPTGFQIADANSPMLRALVHRDGAAVTACGQVEDTPAAILAAMRDDVDVVLISGGSSVGQEDHAPVLLAEHGQLAIHGVAMRPSSPAGMGQLGEALVLLLPGNPVSCLCAYDFFAGRAIRRLGGRPANWPYPTRRLPLSRKLVSQIGRTDYARVKIVDDQVQPLAISGASMLSSTTQADGFVVIAAGSEGYPPGAAVDVYLYG